MKQKTKADTSSIAKNIDQNSYKKNIGWIEKWVAHTKGYVKQFIREGVEVKIYYLKSGILFFWHFQSWDKTFPLELWLKYLQGIPLKWSRHLCLASESTPRIHFSLLMLKIQLWVRERVREQRYGKTFDNIKTLAFCHLENAEIYKWPHTKYTLIYIVHFWCNIINKEVEIM